MTGVGQFGEAAVGGRVVLRAERVDGTVMHRALLGVEGDGATVLGERGRRWRCQQQDRHGDGEQ